MLNYATSFIKMPIKRVMYYSYMIITKAIVSFKKYILPIQNVLIICSSVVIYDM